MADQEEKEKTFSRLLSEVVKVADNNFSLEEVKDIFASEINSTRSLDKARSFREVFRLLEERDLLSWQKVTLLQSLGELLNNERVKEVVRCYKKTCLDEDLIEETCVCGTAIEPNSPTLPLHESNGNKNSVLNTRNNISVDTLNVALENVALGIGTEWGVLARELGLYEIQIDKCCEAHPKDYVRQARMAFKLWRQNQQENASIESLDRALEARLCKRKGIGTHLRNSIFGVNC